MEAVKTTTCRICKHSAPAQVFPIKEMMFGTRESFDYTLCPACKSLQIEEMPGDMARHYQGSTYYSFNNVAKKGRLTTMLRRIVAAQMVGRPDRYPLGIGKIDNLRRRVEPWIALVPGLKRRSLILDVGCGEGGRLESLASLGFSNLHGVDPFLPDDKARPTASGVQLYKGHLANVSGAFDLIMMHHSLEHMPNPGAVLDDARNRLSAHGKILVRIPVLQDWYWERFGVHWSQIDAPRHFYLFSIRAFVTLAERHGLTCISYGCDGAGWALGWSEAYKRGIPMCGPDGQASKPPFAPEDLAAFERDARALNARGEGDQAYFVLEKA